MVITKIYKNNKKIKINIRSGSELKLLFSKILRSYKYLYLCNNNSSNVVIML